MDNTEKTLYVYNTCLRAVNYSPIDSIDTEDYLVAQLQPLVDSVRRRICLKGHPFNTHTTTLPADANGVTVPDTYLIVRLPTNLAETLTIYNGRLYDRTTQQYHTAAIEVEVVLDIALYEMPQAYLEWLAKEAAAEFEVQVHGMTPAFQYLNRQYLFAKQTALNSEPVMALDTMSGFTAIKGAFNV